MAIDIQRGFRVKDRHWFLGEDMGPCNLGVQYILVCSTPTLGCNRLCTRKLIWSNVSGLDPLYTLIVHIYPFVGVVIAINGLNPGTCCIPGVGTQENRGRPSRQPVQVVSLCFVSASPPPLPVPCQVPVPSHCTREEGAQRGPGEPGGTHPVQSLGLWDAPLEQSAESRHMAISIHAVQMFWQNFNLIPDER